MFSDPQKIIDQCGIQAGMIISDFGAGSGAYALCASKALMSTGRVYAVDAQKDLLLKLKNHATTERLHNIETIWGDVEKIGGSKVRESSVDLVFMCNVIFQMDNKDSAIKEAKRVLKTGGRVVCVDWADSFGGIGPILDHVVKKETAKEMFEKNGFHLDREINAGSHHYGFIFKKM